MQWAGIARRYRQQPKRPPVLDRAHPLARDLAFAYLPGFRVDLTGSGYDGVIESALHAHPVGASYWGDGLDPSYTGGMRLQEGVAFAGVPFNGALLGPLPNSTVFTVVRNSSATEEGNPSTANGTLDGGGQTIYTERPIEENGSLELYKIEITHRDGSGYGTPQFTYRDFDNNLLQLYMNSEGVAVNDGKPHGMSIRKDGATHTVRSDGVQKTDTVGGTGRWGEDPGTVGVIGRKIGRESRDAIDCVNSGFNGYIDLVLGWKRTLTDYEIASLEANPWQLFLDTPLRHYFDLVAALTPSVKPYWGGGLYGGRGGRSLNLIGRGNSPQSIARGRLSDNLMFGPGAGYDFSAAGAEAGTAADTATRTANTSAGVAESGTAADVSNVYNPLVPVLIQQAGQPTWPHSDPVTLANPLTAGTYLFAQVTSRRDAGSAPLPAVTGFTLLQDSPYYANGRAGVYISNAPSTGGATGTFPFPTESFPFTTLSEWQVPGVPSLDVFSYASGTSSSQSTGSTATLATPIELILAANFSDSFEVNMGLSAASPGYTHQYDYQNTTNAVAFSHDYKITSTTTAVSASYTTTNNVDWSNIVVAIKFAAGSAFSASRDETVTSADSASSTAAASAARAETGTAADTSTGAFNRDVAQAESSPAFEYRWAQGVRDPVFVQQSTMVRDATSTLTGVAAGNSLFAQVSSVNVASVGMPAVSGWQLLYENATPRLSASGYLRNGLYMKPRASSGTHTFALTGEASYTAVLSEFNCPGGAPEFGVGAGTGPSSSYSPGPLGTSYFTSNLGGGSPHIYFSTFSVADSGQSDVLFGDSVAAPEPVVLGKLGNTSGGVTANYSSYRLRSDVVSKFASFTLGNAPASSGAWSILFASIQFVPDSTSDRTESVTAADAEDGTVAASGFSGAALESLTASETESATLAAAQSIAETAPLSDTQSSTSAAFPNVTETVVSTDSASASGAMARAVAEAATATETEAALRAALAAQAETATALDTQASTGASSAAQVESSPASDVVASAAASFPAVQETVTATETESALKALVSSESESSPATETQAATPTLTQAVQEAAIAVETQVTTNQLVGIAVESAPASDSQASSTVMAAAQAEAAAALDAQNRAMDAAASRVESATALDTEDSTKQLSGVTNESSPASDTQAKSLLADATITETANASDTSAGSPAGFVITTESAPVADTQASTAAATADRAEAAPITDTSNAANQLSLQVVEAATASDLQDRALAAPASLAEATNASDAQTAVATLIAARVEALTVFDLTSAVAAAMASVVESLTVTEISSSVAVGAYNVSAVESVSAQDTQTAIQAAIAAVLEAGLASDVQNAALVVAAFLQHAFHGDPNAQVIVDLGAAALMANGTLRLYF